jgi:hypothetical protein
MYGHFVCQEKNNRQLGRFLDFDEVYLSFRIIGTIVKTTLTCPWILMSGSV